MHRPGSRQPVAASIAARQNWQARGNPTSEIATVRRPWMVSPSRTVTCTLPDFSHRTQHSSRLYRSPHLFRAARCSSADVLHCGQVPFVQRAPPQEPTNSGGGTPAHSSPYDNRLRSSSGGLERAISFFKRLNAFISRAVAGGRAWLRGRASAERAGFSREGGLRPRASAERTGSE